MASTHLLCARAGLVLSNSSTPTHHHLRKHHTTTLLHQFVLQLEFYISLQKAGFIKYILDC